MKKLRKVRNTALFRVWFELCLMKPFPSFPNTGAEELLANLSIYDFLQLVEHGDLMLAGRDFDIALMISVCS